VTLKKRILLLEPKGFPHEAYKQLLSIAEIESCPEKEPPSEGLLKQSQVIFCRLGRKLDDEFFSKCPKLEYIVSPTTGLDHIDLGIAQEKGVKVLSLKGQTNFLRTITATAELTWGLLISVNRHLPSSIASVKAGVWDRNRFIGVQLTGKTIGIIGYGRIGRQVAVYANAFGLKVVWYDPYVSIEDGVNKKARLETLLEKSDFVSVHAPLNPETRKILGAREFKLMKDNVCIINTSRGGLIDEAQLLAGLKTGKVRGAGLDVLQFEFNGKLKDDRLWEYSQENENLIITPHIGGATAESMGATEQHMVQILLEEILGGQHV